LTGRPVHVIKASDPPNSFIPQKQSHYKRVRPLSGADGSIFFLFQRKLEKDRGSEKMEKKWVHTEEAPQPVGPYAQAVKAGGCLYVSGQIPLDPQTGQLLTGSFAEQVGKVLDSLAAILKAGGSSLDAVIKVTVYLSDMAYFNEFNAVYTSYFDRSRPARSCVAVSQLPKGALLEIDAIALCEDS